MLGKIVCSLKMKAACTWTAYDNARSNQLLSGVFTEGDDGHKQSKVQKTCCFFCQKLMKKCAAFDIV